MSAEEASDSISCRACHKPVRQGAKFCRHCGASLALPPPPVAPKESLPPEPAITADPKEAVAPQTVRKNWFTSPTRRFGAIGIAAALIVALVGLAWMKWPFGTPVSPPASPLQVSLRPAVGATTPASVSQPGLPDSVVWEGTAAGCSNIACLNEVMTGGGASTEATAFALQLTAARQGRPAWATRIVPYGAVSLVWYGCSHCRVGGFAFWSRDQPLVLDTSIFGDLDNWLTSNAAIASVHPNALLVSGMHFVNVLPSADGGQQFVFLTNIADCQACTPYSAVEFAFDFDQTGRFEWKAITGVVSPQANSEGASTLGFISSVADRNPTVVSGISFSDPAQYCAAVKTSDNPIKDRRYNGPKYTSKIYQTVHASESDAKTGLVSWRCMSGRILACAEFNSPICGKADTNRVPTTAMRSWCQGNPDTDLPGAVVGSLMNYAWHCAGSIPTITRDFGGLDARGYSKVFWQTVE